MKSIFNLLKQYFKASVGISALLYTTQVNAQQNNLNTYSIKNTANLMEFFKYSEDRVPLVSAHRGGATDKYPENSIAAFDNVLSQINAFFEVDPRLTKDSVIVVLHDATLDRTTTGKGKLADYTWAELKQLKLKDHKGEVTEHRINTLDEVLQWSKGKTILMLDKKDVPLEMLYQTIVKNKAQANVVISSYTAEEARFYHQKDKNLMFEAFIKNEKQLKSYSDAGIPWANLFAYVGQPKDKAFYDLLHQKGIMVMVYTATSFDKLKDAAERKQAYYDIISKGADMILADRAIEASNAIQTLIPAKSSKAQYIKSRKK